MSNVYNILSPLNDSLCILSLLWFGMAQIMYIMIMVFVSNITFLGISLISSIGACIMMIDEYVEYISINWLLYKWFERYIPVSYFRIMCVDVEIEFVDIEYHAHS